MFKSWNQYLKLKWCVVLLRPWFFFLGGRSESYLGWVWDWDWDCFCCRFDLSYLVSVSSLNRLVFDQTWLIVRVSVAQRCNILLCRFFFGRPKTRRSNKETDQGIKERITRQQKEERRKTDKQEQKRRQSCLDSPCRCLRECCRHMIE